MKLARIAFVLFCLCLAALLSPVLAGGLEGRWRLVEQKHGDGDWGLPPEPLEIQFSREGAQLTGRSHLGEGRERRVLAWPALPAADEAQPVTVLELFVSEREDHIRVRFRATPAEGAESIEIIEDYRVVDGGRSLAGEVTVSVPAGGSYRLRRRFDRLP